MTIVTSLHSQGIPLLLNVALTQVMLSQSTNNHTVFHQKYEIACIDAYVEKMLEPTHYSTIG